MTKQHIPKIRFQGFDDEWEESKLDDLGKSSSGTAIEKFFSAEGDFKVISIGSYSEENTYRDQGIRAVLNEKTKNRILNKNDLTMILNDKTSSGNIIGRVLLIDEDNTYVYNQRTQRIQLDSKYYPTYIYQMLNADINRNKLIRAAQGNTQIYVNWSDISKMKYSLPSLPEQESIGQLFRTLDDLISAYNDNLEHYQSLKTSMLSKMFPKEGQKQPEIRLDGFEGDWENVVLGDIGNVLMNKRIFKDETSEYEEIPFYKIGTFGKIADSFISRQKFEEYKAKYPYPQIGDILISASGSIGKIVEYKGEDAYFQDSNIVWLNHGGKLSNSFLKQFYQIVKWDGVEGTTIKRLYNKNILNTKISLPSLPEQEAIGALFANLDETISSYKDKIGQLELLKKNLLSQMFI